MSTYNAWDEFDPQYDIGNPYQHLLDDDADDIQEDLKLGLSVYGTPPTRIKRAS